MVVRDFSRATETARALPRRDRGRALVEAHRLAGTVTRAGDAERAQRAGIDGVPDARARQAPFEQLAQWRAVEQRARVAAAESAGHERGAPAQAVDQELARVGAKHLADAEMAPDVRQPAHALVEARGVDRERGGVDGAGRAAADDGKGIGSAHGQQGGDRLEHADLVSSARATPGQDEPDHRSPAFHRLRHMRRL